MDEPDLSLVNYSLASLSNRSPRQASLNMSLKQQQNLSPGNSLPHSSQSPRLPTYQSNIEPQAQHYRSSPRQSVPNRTVPIQSDQLDASTSEANQSHSLLSFEQHEESLRTSSEYSLLHQGSPFKKPEDFRGTAVILQVCLVGGVHQSCKQTVKLTCVLNSGLNSGCSLGQIHVSTQVI